MKLSQRAPDEQDRHRYGGIVNGEKVNEIEQSSEHRHDKRGRHGALWSMPIGDRAGPKAREQRRRELRARDQDEGEVGRHQGQEGAIGRPPPAGAWSWKLFFPGHQRPLQSGASQHRFGIARAFDLEGP